MEGIEMEDPQEVPFLFEEEGEEGGDLGSSILSRFRNSQREDHQHLCAVVGAMSQELKDQGFPLAPVSYFGATAASLGRLSQDPSSGSDPVLAALLTFLSVVLPGVPPAALRSRAGPVSETVQKILAFGTASDGAVKAALMCVPRLLVVGDKASWSSVCSLYRVLLNFVTDSRPEVRKLSQSCLRDVLQGFQSSPVLASASEGITTLLERFLLLAGGSKSKSTAAVEGGAIGAWDILYILNALKYCLPLMSLKSRNNILKYCKTLLELQHPVVTRNIVDISHALCCSPTSKVAPEVFIDVLCSLASSASDKENFADAMALTARLLHLGSKKVYDLDRQICVVKLPTIFNALGGILAQRHPAAVITAAEAFKGLICSCIDDNLVKQGVDQIKLNPDRGARRSDPTIIEKICAIIEGLLGYQYNAVWDMSFQVLAAMFEKLGEYSSCMMHGAIKNLAEMQKLSDEVLDHRNQLHECVGVALRTLGPEIFLALLPLNLDVEDLSEANLWLFPILKQYTVGARLSFFRQSILSMVRCLQHKYQKLEREGRIVSARSTKSLVYSLWSLLPAFCNYPLDTATSFRGLQKVLCGTLQEEPDLRGLICSSLQILIQQNRRILTENVDVLNDEMSNSELKARACYTPKLAEENINAIRSLSPEFFSILSEILFKSSKDSGGCLQSTICEFATISDKKIVKKFFTHTMSKLLKVIEESKKADQGESSSSMQIDSSSCEESLLLTRALLLDLAVSLLPGLDVQEIDCLFSAIEHGLQDKEGLIQKKAYKILSIIIKERVDFLSSKLGSLLGLMIDALPSCHFSAKRHRLECLYHLIVFVSKDAPEKQVDIISSFLTEIILALKESNKKARNRAYDLLVDIGHACGDEEQGGKKECLQQFFNMIAVHLAGETPHMISAAIKGLARLTYEFTDLVNTAYNLLPSTFLLLQRGNCEIIKAILGLLKVLVAKSQADGLHMNLRSMVEGLLKWQDYTKNHFKAKVKFLFEMLVKKYGLDAVKAVMPEEHMRLLTNIRKIKERKERKGKPEEESKSLHSRASTRLGRWNHTCIFSTFGDDDDDDGEYDSTPGYMNAKKVSDRKIKASAFSSKVSSLRSKRKHHQSSKSLPEDLFDQLEDDPLDLLDRQKTRSSLRSSMGIKSRAESDDEPEIDPDGRLVIREDKVKRKEKHLSSRNDSDTRNRTGSCLTAKDKGKQRNFDASSSVGAQRKRQKTADSGWAYAGSEYTSKKASGDVKRKDKLEPYAYWPLDRKLLNRRVELKSVARKGMATVMKRKHAGKGSSALSVKGAALTRKQMKAKKKSKQAKTH